MSNHLWQSTLFAALAGLLAFALRKNRAQVRYWLWFSASLKFFVPFALLMSLGSHFQWTPAARPAAPVSAALSTSLVEIAQPFPETAPFEPSAPRSIDWSIVIIGVWLCGSVVIALMRLRDWLRIRAAVRASIPIEIPATVEIRTSQGLLEPGVVGFLRPILLLPEGIAERLTRPQLEAVLAHELCHVRRRDNLFAAIHMIVEATFWFHPLVWWIGARLVDERERACDEEVLTLGSEPRVYAEGILNVCKMYVESPLACVSGVTGSDLKKRIHAILTARVAADLNFARKAVLATAGIAVLALPIIVGTMHVPRVLAQSTPKFEVASIKLCAPEAPLLAIPQVGVPGAAKGGGRGGNGGGGSSPGRLYLNCVPGLGSTVRSLIQDAYDIYQNGRRLPVLPPNFLMLAISGGPDWVNTDNYQIEAKAEGNPSQEMMMGPMLQALLEDRFKLKLHRETKEGPAYALTVAKGGFKLPRLPDGSCVPLDLEKVRAPLAPGDAPPNFCGAGGIARRGMLETRANTLENFSRMLSRVFSRPVIDKTGIAGLYNFHLEFTPDDSTPWLVPPGGATPADPAGGPSIFTAIQEQLGLKLESAKGPGEILVIDSVERPSEN